MSTTKRPSSAGSAQSQTLENGSLQTGHEERKGPNPTTDMKSPPLDQIPSENVPEPAKKEALQLQDALDDEAWATSPQNPLTWSTSKKWTMAAVVSVYTFVSPLASSMLAPGLPAIALKYNITNSTLAAMPLSIFILAYAFGPLFISPLSEIYGRKWVLHISNIVFLIFNLVCTWAPNSTALIIFRFFSGIGGSTPVSIGGSVISDLFLPEDRAAAMAIYSMGPLIGPVVGPIAGGYISETIGIKWIFIIITLLAGVAGILGIIFLRETYEPVLRARLIKETVSDKEKAQRLSEVVADQPSKGEIMWVNMTRPIVLCKSFILFILSLFMAVQYGNLYLMFATFPDIFPEVYGFSAGVTGLMYLGFGIGFFVATIFGATFANTVYLRVCAALPSSKPIIDRFTARRPQWGSWKAGVPHATNVGRLVLGSHRPLLVWLVRSSLSSLDRSCNRIWRIWRWYDADFPTDPTVSRRRIQICCFRACGGFGIPGHVRLLIPTLCGRYVQGAQYGWRVLPPRRHRDRRRDTFPNLDISLWGKDESHEQP